MNLTFDEFQLDTERYELRRDGDPCAVEPKVFDLLVHLARHPNQVFSRDDLIDAIWQGRVVSDATVSTCIKNARRALGDSGAEQRYIKTVRGRGVRFDANVSMRGRQSDDAATARDRAPTPDAHALPSLALQPFQRLSDDGESMRWIDGLHSELGSVLTRIPLLRITTHPSRGAHYVLEGTVNAEPERVRISVRLVDGPSGFQRWAEQLEVPASANGMLEAAVLAVVAKLEPQLHRAIYETVRARVGDPNAFELFLEASGILALKGWHHETFSEAARLLRRSRQLDPGFALAPAYLSLVVGLGDRVGLMADRDAARAEALDAAEQALALDAMDSTVLGFAGCALADIGYVDRALPILRHAVELSASNAQAWAALGSACLIKGQAEEAAEHLAHGIRISPLDSRLSIWGAMLALARVRTQDLDDALAQATLACQRDDRSYIPRLALAAVELLRRSPEAALSALHDAYRIKPDLSALEIRSLLGQRLGAGLAELAAGDGARD